jgi:hypothetical protein
MWILKLSMTSLWMTGVVMSRLQWPWHLIALAVIALVIAEGTAFERRLAIALHLRTRDER